MKKVLLLIIICFGLLLADKVQILGIPNIRVAPKPKAAITTNTIVYDVLDTHGDYYKIKVNGKGITGWVTVKILDFNKTKAEAIIKGSGGNVRAEPTKNSDQVGVVHVGDSVSIIKCKVTWYQIALGWIYKGAVKLIKE